MSVLVEAGVGGLEEVDGRGLTALHHAAISGSWRTVLSLLDAGSDAKKGTLAGVLPLHYFCGRSFEDIEV